MNNTESYPQPIPVAALDENSRGKFISRVYSHLFCAISAFVLLEIALFKSGSAEPIAEFLLRGSWLWVLGGFMILSWLASFAAHRAQSKAVQYAALAAYVGGEALIFVPLLYLADKFAPGAIASAAAVTFLAFTGLSLVAFITRKDFSFFRGLLIWGGVTALVLIIGGVGFGFQLGTYFSVAMVGLAGCAILYDTSNVLHRYSEDRYVAASLQLFASVALMMWYVLRIFTSRR